MPQPSRKRASRRVAIAAAFAAAWLPVHAGTIDPALAARADRPTGTAQRPLAVIIELAGRPDLASLAPTLAARAERERPGALALHLRAAFERAAPPVRGALERAGAMQVEPLWLVHGFAAQLPPKSLRAVAAAPGVARVYADMQLKSPVRLAPTSARVALRREQAVDRSAQKIAAAVAAVQGFDPAAWRGELPAHVSAVGAATYWQRGAAGQGVTVAVIDSGVDARDAAAMAAFRGGPNDWFDPYRQRARPFDAGHHGTHVAQVIAGAPAMAGSAPLGVAPRARWIAARIYDDAGAGSVSAVHRAYQWALDPDGKADTADAPLIVNNSWGLPRTVGRCDTEFARDFAALRAAGIHVVFAAGNDGPGAGTSMSPANNPGVLAVGAIGPDGKVIDQSGRGPSACGGGAYPQALAPGVDVQGMDAAGRVLGEPLRATGTSFAAALASGMLALVASASPGLPLAERERVLGTVLAGDASAAATTGTPTALGWKPTLGPTGGLEIDAAVLQRVLPWTAKVARIDIETRPAQGKLETAGADRLRYTAEAPAAGAAAKPAPFVLVARTADGRDWRLAVEPQPAQAAGTVAMRRLSVAARGGEPVQLSRAQIGGDTAFKALHASQTIRGGQVDVLEDGGLVYTPRAGFRGTDQFVCTLLAADGAPRERVQVAVMVR